jgi:hypothetical protein
MALVVLGLVALLPDCASACSCVPPPPGQSEQEKVRRELADSSAVVAGEVVDLKRGFLTTKVSFRVSEVWKGPERETLELNTPSQGGACGYRFSEGQEYLVYAWGKKMEVYGACGRTGPLSKAGADLAVLGNGKEPEEGDNLTDTSGGFPPLGVIGMLGGAVAAVSLVVLMRVVRTG